MAVIGYFTPQAPTMTFWVTELDTSYSGNDRYIQWYANGTYKGITPLQANRYMSDDFYMDGLSFGTVYTILARIYYNNGASYVELTVSITTPSNRPPFFSWDSEKISGRAFSLYASEWNRLTANINAVRQYKNYANYSFTFALSGQPFTAIIFNQAAIAIRDMTLSAPANTTSGSVIMASALNQLVSAVNGIN